MGKGTYRYRRRRPPSRRPEALFFLGLIALAIFGCVGWYVLSQPEPVTDSQVAMTNEVPTSGRQADVSRQSEPAGGVTAAPVATQPIAAGDPSLVKPASVGPVRPADAVAPMNHPVSVSGAINGNSDKWQDDPTARHANCPLPADIQTGSFQIQTKMPTLPTVQCDYRIPMGDNGRPMPTAADIVLVFPFPTEKAAIFGISKRLTEKSGFTTVSIRFPGMGPNDGISGDDHSRWYYWPESGAGAAWNEAIDRVCRIGGFPGRQVFTTGLSGGGSAAGIFADSYPARVFAVASMAGRVFSDRHSFEGPILIMHGAHDYVVPTILEYVQKNPIVQLHLTRVTFPPSWEARGKSVLWQHQFGGAAELGFFQWIVGVADLRLANNGVLPTQSTWTVRANGLAFPDGEVCNTFAKIPSMAMSRRYGGSDVLECNPIGGLGVCGTIVIVATGMKADLEELSLDAEYLAENGWRCISMVGDLSALPALMANLQEKLNMVSSPWILALDGEDISNDFLTKLPSRPIGVVLSDVDGAGIQSFAKNVSRYGVSIGYVGDKLRVDRLSMLRFPSGLESKVIAPINLGSWHGQRSRAILEFSNAWSSGKR